MTISSLPAGLNPLSPNGFNFAITKAPNLTFFCQEATLPGITLGDPAFSTPFATAPLPGDHLTYDTLQIRFLIDEQMLNYNMIYNWIVALGFPDSYSQYVNLINGDTTAYGELAKTYSDATMQILDANNNAIRTITFTDCFPIALESVTFSSTNDGVNYLVGSATFRFTLYEFA
jgi:hypothetical protein